MILSDKGVDIALATRLCALVAEFCMENCKSRQMGTMRSLVRLLNSTYLLQDQSTNMDFPSALWNAYSTTFASQFKETDKWGEEMTTKVLAILLQTNKPPVSPDFQLNSTGSNAHVLTPSRKRQAEAVLMAIACNIPVLLEGPAAVGKTALITHLAENQPHKKRLERVNNTETTSIQDYMGSYLPMGDGFVFHEGALSRAMKNGWWFLSDEFNLAEPDVLNYLCPLLEGKGYLHVPGSNKIVQSHPDFRFFATQNDAKYASRHQLPTSLRNRFLEVQVNDFPQAELPEIIQRRWDSGKSTIPSAKLAELYYALASTPNRITMREIIKWVRRQSLFQHSTWQCVGTSLLCGRYLPESDSAHALLAQFDRVWGSVPRSSDVLVEQKGPNVFFKEGMMNITLPGVSLARSPLWSHGRCPPESFLRVLARIAFAVHRLATLSISSFDLALIRSSHSSLSSRRHPSSYLFLTN
jgi:MoxR-like ATPase